MYEAQRETDRLAERERQTHWQRDRKTGRETERLAGREKHTNTRSKKTQSSGIVSGSSERIT